MTFVEALSTKKLMMSKFSMSLFSAIVLVILLSINGCHGLFFTSAKASSVPFHGPLKVALQEDLTAKSLEKDLIINFALAHSIKLKFISFKNLAEAETLLNQEKADLVFTRSTLSESNFKGHFSMIYDDLQLSVLCPDSLATIKELYIPDRFFYATQTKNFLKIFKKLSWIKTTLSNPKLKKLAPKKNICYMADTRLAQKNKLTDSHLRSVWTSKKSEPVAWITRYDLKELNYLIYSWFQGLVRQNQIRKFWDQYEAFEFKMTTLEQRRIEKDISQKLPRWRNLFEKAAKKNKIPWTLLAAVAYQESKWDETAKSYTGVRGLMQITTRTAKHLGINDREDPIQSIEGGAYYLKYLYDKTPMRLPPYERWAQALAAYNIGWAHIRDTRNLCKRLNKDSYRWLQFKTVLPLLSDKKYFSKLAFGAARGEETVEFVDQVFGYTEVLNNLFTRRLLTSRDF